MELLDVSVLEFLPNEVKINNQLVRENNTVVMKDKSVGNKANAERNNADFR